MSEPMRTFQADFNTVGAHPGRITGVLDLGLLGERVLVEDGEGNSCEGTVDGLKINWQGSHLLVDILLHTETWQS